MECDLLIGLMKTAIEHQIHKIDADWVKLADSHAVSMLGEIRRILDSHFDSDEKIDKIMKILLFMDVGPHKIE